MIDDFEVSPDSSDSLNLINSPQEPRSFHNLPGWCMRAAQNFVALFQFRVRFWMSTTKWWRWWLDSWNKIALNWPILQHKFCIVQRSYLIQHEILWNNFKVMHSQRGFVLHKRPQFACAPCGLDGWANVAESCNAKGERGVPHHLSS